MVAPGEPRETETIPGLSADNSLEEASLSERRWRKHSAQQDTLIQAVVKVFTWLNGGVYLLVLVAWVVGHFSDYKVVDGNTPDGVDCRHRGTSRAGFCSHR
ncbi:MAG: hypothetical protein JWR68_2132 [Polaromonas sp.]|nr:hypothetical protein [Polaromonas sp.]